MNDSAFMKNLLASLRTCLVIVLLVAIVFFVPSFNFSFDVSTLLSVISLLFAILVGFFFAAVTSNYLSLQALVPQEDAMLINIYNHASLIDPKKAKELAEKIDDYMIAVLDYEILTYAPHVRKELKSIVETVDKIQPSDVRGQSLIQNLHNYKSSLFQINQQTNLVAQSILSFSHWCIIIMLSILIDILLLGLRTGNWINLAIIAVLFITPYLILNLLYELDSNLFLAKHLSFKLPQNVFEAIGRLHYYPETALKAGIVRHPEKPYRVGHYIDFPKSNRKTIKVVKR